LDNGKSIGKTSELEMNPEAEPVYAATPEEALEDLRFSKAAYPLEAGAHEITIKVADSVNENGTGAVRVVQKVQSLKKKHDKEDDEDDEDDDEDDKDYQHDEHKEYKTEYIKEYKFKTEYIKKFKTRTDTDTDTVFVFFTVPHY
jgi:hypothetical protein